MRITRWALHLFVLAAPIPALAQPTPLSAPTLRLVKSPDAKDVSKPAVFGFQRNDGGKDDYFTQGAIKADWDLDANGNTTLSPGVGWNHNTLATTPTDNWNVNLGLTQRWLYRERGKAHDLDALVFSVSAAQQRDATKSSNARTVKAGATWYTHLLEIPPRGTPRYAMLRPTVTVFDKHVLSAAPDKVTGIAPKGTMNGVLISLDGTWQWDRWSARASSQALRTLQVVQGDVKATHRLHTLSLTYIFVDSPMTVAEQKATVLVPGLTLMRQVGADPLNAIPRAGYTQLAFTLRY